MPDQARLDLDLDDLARAVAGDQVAFARLFARHEASLRGLARLLSPDLAAAEDVVQEALLAAARHAPSFRAEGSVRAWLLAITRRAALRQRRRRAGEPAQWEPLDDDTPLHALGVAAGWGAPPTPEALMDAHERQEALARLLAQLSEADRAVIHLRDLEGLTYEEVASALEEPLSTVKTRLHRARLRLMALARAPQGGTDDTRA